MSGTPAWVMEQLACPDCATALRTDQGSLNCESCGRVGELKDGVPHLVEKAPYWGEVPQKDMRQLLSLCDRYGWRDGLERFFDEDPSIRRDRLVEKLHDPSVGNWAALFDLDEESMAMDIGAGLGTMTWALAKRYKRVVALEQVPERIEFIHLRSAEEGLAERVGVVCADAYRLPFAPGTFDLISMNGVLEWLPLADSDPDPQESQRKIIRSALRLLKPGGVFYIGIEGRYALRQLLGQGGPHYEGAFTAVLPRPLARWNHRRTNQEEYRTYVHSPQVLGRMLREEGFQRVDLMDASPSYNVQRFLTPFAGKGMLEYRKRQLRDRPLGSPKWEAASSFLQASGLGERSSVQYLVFGRKGNS